MEAQYYRAMTENLEEIEQAGILENKKIFLFGHCHATEKLADLLLGKGYAVSAILDNNAVKHGNEYRGIVIQAPQEIIREAGEDVIVCIAARAYAAMTEQLRRLGFQGMIRKLVDYNSYADYSLSEETINCMTLRRQGGEILFSGLKKKYPDCFRILCPFAALGDIYIMMSYLPHFLSKRGIDKCVVGVIGNACAQVVRLFGFYPVEVLSQKDMDEMIQAALYEQDADTYIPHQDRPYVVKLSNALYIKPITLEQMYCCGVFGLPADTKPCEPVNFSDSADLDRIRDGKAVIFSPYAKSVTSFPEAVWEQIVACCTDRGYQCFTNVAGEEKPLPGTEAISPRIAEMKSVVERAGTFVGIRSGLCDVIRSVNARKIALYPDYNYSDTKWKAIDIYALAGWENIVRKEDGTWERR